MNNLRYFDGIQYGDFTGLEVLVDPDDNSLFVSQPTIERILNYPSNSARKKLGAKSLASFTGKALTVGKDVTAIDSSGKKNKVKAIPFDTFLSLVYWEAFEGKPPANDNARALILAGFADSFSSLVLEQCGIKLTHAERQSVITHYRHWYHSFFDWVRDEHIRVHNQKPSNEYYRAINVTINKFLFDRNHFNCNRLKYAESDDLREIEGLQMQFLKSGYCKRGGDPLTVVTDYFDALKSVIG